jgi:6-phosphogluconolactonase (cycloisomerase 2 family)
VQVTCATNSYSVGVTVSGLVGTGLALSLNGGVPVPIPGNGAFQFPGVLPSGSNFNVEVTTQPLGPTQSCLTTNGSGTVGGGDVSVIANCATISAFAYVFGRPLPGLVGYTVDLLTGRLTQLPGPAFSNPGAAVPSNVLPSRDGKHLYLTEGGTIYVYSITPPPSPQMGSLSLVGTTTIDPISGLAIDAGGKFLYATSNAQGSAGYVAAFNIDATTGALSRIATYLSGSGPSGVAVYPTASFLLVTNYTSNNVSVFSIDTGAGTLAPVSGSPFPAGRGPESVAITPNGKFAYVGNYGASNGEPPYVSSYTVDSSTGILTSISNAIGIENPTAVAVDPTGQYLFVSGDMMYIQECDAINAISGVPTFPCPFRFPPLVPNGGVFAEAPAAYAFDPTGQFMYVTSAIGTSVAQFTSSPVNLTVVQSITGFYNGSPSGGGIAIAPVK